MKKTTNKDKKQTNSNSPKGVKLPLIQSNIQKGNLKEGQGNASKGKGASKNQDVKINISEVPQMPNINQAKNLPKNEKSFVNSDKNQNTNKTKANADGKKKKTNNYNKDELNKDKDNGQDGLLKFTEEKLSQLKEQRKQRLKQERKEEEKQIKFYEKLIEEYKTNGKSKKSKNIQIENLGENPKVIVSSKKAQTILEEGGMLDAYKHVLAQLCKNGLPSGNIFEYASYVVKAYEKKWKEKKSQMMKDKIDKYYEEKQKEINKSLETDGEIKIVNKSLEHRDELKFIQSLDKSRSGRNVVPRINNSVSPKLDKIGKNSVASNKLIKKTKAQNIINDNNENNNNISSIKLMESSAENNNKVNNNMSKNKSKETVNNKKAKK